MENQKSSPLTSILSPSRGEAGKCALSSPLARPSGRLSSLETAEESNGRSLRQRGGCQASTSELHDEQAELGRLSAKQEERGKVRS